MKRKFPVGQKPPKLQTVRFDNGGASVGELLRALRAASTTSVSFSHALNGSVEYLLRGLREGTIHPSDILVRPDEG